MSSWEGAPGQASTPEMCPEALPRKVENLAAARSLHFIYYNFARAHMSLANPYMRPPATAAGLGDHIWEIEAIAELLGE